MTERKLLKEPAPAAVDPAESARAAGLRYVYDDRPGIRRVRAGKGFRYVGPDGRAVRDAETLKRIRSLVIPPAWTDVWICPVPNGHLQASGRDARGRKQYRYHPRWRETRDATKYDRMTAFGLALPAIRARTEADLALPGLPRPKVLAGVVRLLETTLMRVGNEEYARANGSYGLTTLRDRHVEVNGAAVRFHFRGKSGVRHAVDVNDRRLARLIRRCQDLPGHELFQYVDDEGATRTIDSADVNEYLREIAGSEFTAKDFRTWGGTVRVAEALLACEACERLTRRKRNVVAAIAATARRLGNTVAVCRKCYVHPAVIEAYLDGSLAEALGRPAEKNGAAPAKGLRPEEAAVLKFLQERLSAPVP
jgi:DNA topoisomerase I